MGPACKYCLSTVVAADGVLLIAPLFQEELLTVSFFPSSSTGCPARVPRQRRNAATRAGKRLSAWVYRAGQGKGGGFGGCNANTRFRTGFHKSGTSGHLPPAGAGVESCRAGEGRGGGRYSMKRAGCRSDRAGTRPGRQGGGQVGIQVQGHLLGLLVKLVWKHSASAIYATDQGRAGTGRRIGLKQGFRTWELVGAGMAEQRIQWAFPLSVPSGDARQVQAGF